MMGKPRELQTGVGTDLVRALLDKLDLDEWVSRYAVVLLDAVDFRDKRIVELEHKPPSDACTDCWTSSWAPCEWHDEDAIEFKGEWVVCQQCQVEKWNRQHRERITELEHELEESRKAFRYELNEVKCADEAIVDLETERDRLCEAIIEEYKTKGTFEKVYDMATEILGDE